MIQVFRSYISPQFKLMFSSYIFMDCLEIKYTGGQHTRL